MRGGDYFRVEKVFGYDLGIEIEGGDGRKYSRIESGIKISTSTEFQQFRYGRAYNRCSGTELSANSSHNIDRKRDILQRFLTLGTPTSSQRRLECSPLTSALVGDDRHC